MRLIEKSYQIIKDNERFMTYSDCVIMAYESMMIRINKLKETIDELSKTRKKNQSQERLELSNRILYILDLTKFKYEDFIFELSDLSYLIVHNPRTPLTNKTKKKMVQALECKNLLKKEFETIYRNFKNMAKKLEDIPMREMLSEMRETFDLNNTNLNSTFKILNN